VLAPGEWTVLVTSPRLGVAQRTLTMPDPPGGLVELEVPLVPPDATLTDLVLRIEDPDRGPVVGAAVWLDDSRIGQTGEGGVVVAPGLPPGTARLRVEAPDFVDLVEDQLVLQAGTSERRFTMRWVPVPLSVTATDEAGQPVSAEVRFSGRADVAPVQARGDGVARVELRPGAWQVIAAEAARGLGPARAEVVLEAGSDGEAVPLVLERARVELTASGVEIKEQVSFEFDSAQLTDDSGPVLQQVADTLLSQAGIVRLEVQGHTDNIGDIAYNQALSERRAEAVRRALVERGVPPEKLVARGYGTQRPVADNTTDEGRALNRRVVFEIVEQIE
jgi:outer membrane protein OmpA-like peptidoglycan-associated protein